MRVILPATTIPTAHPRCSLWLKIPLVVLGSSSRYGSKFPSLWLKNPPVVGTWPKAGAAIHIPPLTGRVALGLLRPCFARLLASLVGQPDACGAGESLRDRNCRAGGSQLVATAWNAAYWRRANGWVGARPLRAPTPWPRHPGHPRLPGLRLLGTSYWK